MRFRQSTGPSRSSHLIIEDDADPQAVLEQAQSLEAG